MRDHTPWQMIRELAISGVTLRALAQQFGLRESTLRSRAQRERWNITMLRMANKAKLPDPADQLSAELTQSTASQALPIMSEEAKLAAALILRDALNHLARFSPKGKFGKANQLKLLIDAASKLFSWNDAKQTESHRPIVNLALLAARPEELALAHAREIQAKLDSQSSEAADPPRGTPNVGEAKSGESADPKPS